MFVLILRFSISNCVKLNNSNWLIFKLYNFVAVKFVLFQQMLNWTNLIDWETPKCFDELTKVVERTKPKTSFVGLTKSLLKALKFGLDYKKFSFIGKQPNISLTKFWLKNPKFWSDNKQFVLSTKQNLLKKFGYFNKTFFVVWEKTKCFDVPNFKN